MTPSSPSGQLAPLVGLLGAVACAIAAIATAFLGLSDSPATLALGYLFGGLMGLLGAIVARRQPGNRMGWLMGATALATSLVSLPTDYAYAALVVADGRWPFGPTALWLGGWAWIVVVGLALPVLAVRFPTGTVRGPWRTVDGLAIAGTMLFAAGSAFGPASTVPLPAFAAAALAPYLGQAFGLALPQDVAAELHMGGLPIILAAYLAAGASLIARFRRSSPDERLQLKWFAFAGLMVAAAVVYAGIASIGSGQSLAEALVPFELILVTLPLAIGIGILRYRLYDIDLLINRTLVYLGATAALGALYVAVITLLQRLFISASGARSDAAYVITAFVVVAAFGPIKDWLQRKVDRQLGGTRGSAALDEFRARLEFVVAALDGRGAAEELLDRAVTALDARGGAVYLGAGRGIAYATGELGERPAIEVPLLQDGAAIGRLVLADRRGHASYGPRERTALELTASSVAAALALAERIEQRAAIAPAKVRTGLGTPLDVRVARRS